MSKLLVDIIEHRKEVYLEDGDDDKFQIPNFVVRNLKHSLFDWQKSALENFLIFDRISKLKDFPEIKNRPTHLLFNMATGAGKTLMMAALMLYYYEKGYRHFLFFVNQNNIIDKTENNFVDSTHAKYLFQPQIMQGDEIVPIQKVERFSQDSQGIEIKFTSIQQLYNDIHVDRENKTTLADLDKFKIVMFGDEAHHLNAQTKKGQNLELDLTNEITGKTSTAEIERKGWEYTVLKLLLNKQDKPSENVLLEFTATLPENAEVREKYQDKIISKFTLKEFLQKGYTKEINLVSSTLSKKERVLHALLFAWYRHQVAMKYGIANFKPVMLFRSRTIEDSEKDYAEFLDWVTYISAKDFDFLTQLAINLSETDNANEQGKTRTEQVLRFMQLHNFTNSHLADWIKHNYRLHNIVITNSKTNNKTQKSKEREQAEQIEKQLNNLEESNNPIRAIFTVDRLTEGWDVLNLFDIVRLYEGQNTGGSTKKAGKVPASTVAEKQLIGRGVRYFPFDYEDKPSNKRKFDNDIQHDLRILEELFYYTYDEKSRYISELKAELRKDGFIASDEDKTLLTIGIKQEYKQKQDLTNWLIWLNKREENPNAKTNNAKSLINNPKTISWQVNHEDFVQETHFNTDIERHIGENNTFSKIMNVSDIDKHIFNKALHIKGKDSRSLYLFKHLQAKLKISSRNELQCDLLSNWKIEFLGLNQYKEISSVDKLKATLKLLDVVEQYLNSVDQPFIGTKTFEAKSLLKIFGQPKQKWVNKESINKNITKHDWYVMDQFAGNQLEENLIEFIAERMGELSQNYDFHLIRNEEVYKIHAFDNGEGFQPDFLLLLKSKQKTSIENINDILHYQIFIEPKGEHLIEKDAWKANFLKAITNEYGEDNVIKKDTLHYRLIGLPFFRDENENNQFNAEFKLKFSALL